MGMRGNGNLNVIMGGNGQAFMYYYGNGMVMGIRGHGNGIEKVIPAHFYIPLINPALNN